MRRHPQVFAGADPTKFEALTPQLETPGFWSVGAFHIDVRTRTFQLVIRDESVPPGNGQAMYDHAVFEGTFADAGPGRWYVSCGEHRFATGSEQHRTGHGSHLYRYRFDRGGEMHGGLESMGLPGCEPHYRGPP
jgi:hypothetical protein